MPLPRPLRALRAALDFPGRRIQREMRRLAAALPPAERVLDLGSGGAPYANLFPHRRYVAADLSGPADVRCDATALPFARQSFDRIVCTEMLEHVPDPDAALAEMRRVIRDEGVLILTTPLTWGVHSVQDYHRWTAAALRRLLARHGFLTAEVRPRGGVLFGLAAILLVVPWQVFGPSAERRPWQSALFWITYLLLLPPAFCCLALDGLDRRREFTNGYVALARAAAGTLAAAPAPSSTSE
jgi:SAM-dependent methyltransferase